MAAQFFADERSRIAPDDEPVHDIVGLDGFERTGVRIGREHDTRVRRMIPDGCMFPRS